jgi:hypothetical protein
MLRMVRTTIFLPDELHERLRSDAFEARVSMAELIRRRLEKTRPRRPELRKDYLGELDGCLSHGRLSEDIDETLYGL